MTNALAKLSNEVVSSNDEMHALIERVKSETIPLFPDTLNFGFRPEFKLSATLVTVDVNNNKDVYRNESGQFSLHLTKLNEISQAAGLVVVGSKIAERKTDERGLVIYISHEISWEMKSIDGSIKKGVQTGKYDYYNDVATKSEKQVRQRRKHAEALAESNALTRAFNKAIAKLPQGFTQQELKKPFCIPCVVEDKNELIKSLPKEVQDRVNEDYVRKQLGISNAIYGGPAPTNKLNASEESEPQPNSSSGNINNIPDATFTESSNGMSQEEQNKITAEEFRGSPQPERTAVIMKELKRTGYTDKDGVPFTEQRVEKNSVDTQIKFLEKLLNMEEVVEDLI